MAEFVFQMIKARKSYGDRVILDDVTLSFLPGAKIGVVGPNGMGKSTLLKLISGVLRPDGRHPAAGAAAGRHQDRGREHQDGVRPDCREGRPIQ